jgi:nitrite reductase/ring-hydroxylating ferredoxin subunit
MMVYFAWALLVLHVALGALQAERAPLPTLLTGAGVLWIVGLHLAAGVRERRADTLIPPGERDWIDVGSVDEIPEKRARGVLVAGERVAVFRYDGKVSAVSGVCQHQNGPLAEGRIVDGLITCPWHGYQYLPNCGRSPAPFTERIPSFRVRVVNRRVLIDPRPLAPGTETEPALIEGAAPCVTIATSST